jgi:ribosomal protein S15P/S13E
MDLATTYCPNRRDIEEHIWVLTSRLVSLSEHLLRTIGKDHLAFLALQQECHTTRDAIAESNQSLRDHRRDHGC